MSRLPAVAVGLLTAAYVVNHAGYLPLQTTLGQ